MTEIDRYFTTSDEDRLGSAEQTVSGDTLEGKYTGQGFIDGSSGEGAFLADVPHREIIEQYINERGKARLRNVRITEREPKKLHIGDLFPENWAGKKVEYEITVKAKLVNPQPNPRRGSQNS